MTKDWSPPPNFMDELDDIEPEYLDSYERRLIQVFRTLSEEDRKSMLFMVDVIRRIINRKRPLQY